MKLLNSKWFVPVVAVCLIVGLFTAFYMTAERDPAFQPQMTTFDGKPAFGCLHRPNPDGTQDYTFYYYHQVSGNGWVIDSEIATFPASEAAKLH